MNDIALVIVSRCQLRALIRAQEGSWAQNVTGFNTGILLILSGINHCYLNFQW